MFESSLTTSFEAEVVPLLDVAYNLARWLTRNDQDAQDVVQEAYIRAFRSFAGFRGGNTRAWLLKIVRNTCFTWLQQNRRIQQSVEFDEEVFNSDSYSPNPEEILLQSASRLAVHQALESLPDNFREVLVLRELEELSYQEIADITGAPMGTIMSRLSRSRDALRQSLTALAYEPGQLKTVHGIGHKLVR